jgi:hypothetical protein
VRMEGYTLRQMVERIAAVYEDLRETSKVTE